MILIKALFIELNDVLISTFSKNINPIHSEDWRLDVDVLDVIIQYYLRGYQIVIVSDEKGIELGYTSEKVFKRKIEKICKEVEKFVKMKKNHIQYLYNKDSETFNSFPNPGLFYSFAEDLEVSLYHSIYVGKDANSRLVAKNAGINNYYIKLEAILKVTIDNAR
jgi:histidinol phosphatase-like enzyme